MEVPLYLNDGKVVCIEQKDNLYKISKKENKSQYSKLKEANEVAKHLKQQKVVVVDSTKSGTGRNKDDIYQVILKPIFEELNILHEYFSSVNANSIEELGKNWVRHETTFLIFISGDTSINEFINGLNYDGRGNKIIFHHIPAGTGNSISLSLKVLDVAQSIQKLLDPLDYIPFNTYQVTFPKGSYKTIENKKVADVRSLYFVVVFSWGFHASLVADSDTPEMRKHGIERFQIAAQSNLQEEQKYCATISISSSKIPIEGPLAYFVLTATEKFEPAFDISPKGDIKDDNLWLVCFNTEEEKEETKGNSDNYIVDIMKKVYNHGDHINDKRVLYTKISKSEFMTLRVSESNPPRRRRFCVDGSIIQVPEGISDITISTVGNIIKGWQLEILC